MANRLEELAALARPFGRGIVWPHTIGINDPVTAIEASWCNGAAGFVYVWTIASRLFGEPRFDSLATAAAWTAFEGPQDCSGDLCCGLSGRAYALLCLCKHTSQDVWRDRARVLASRAASSIVDQSLRHDSLYKGDFGVALLAADLESPDHACM